MNENEKFLADKIAEADVKAHTALSVVEEICILLVKKGFLSKEEIKTLSKASRAEQ